MTTCCTPDQKCQPSTAADSSAVKPRYFVDGTKEAYEARIELPGVAKEGLSIDLDENVLTVRARRKPAAAADWKPLHRELGAADYLLRLKLSTQVDESKLTATLEHGVLTLRLPVKEAVKPRRIEVQ